MTINPQSSLHHTGQVASARAFAQRDSEPRAARVHFTVKVVGVGESRLDGSKALKFGALLLDEPAFTFGVIADGPVGGGAMPQATAVVLAWVQGQNGLYIGAELGFRVQSSQPKIALRFSLTFEASALRSTAGVAHALGENGTLNPYQGP